MLRSLASPPSTSALLFDPAAGDLCRRRLAAIACSGQRSSSSIPKLEPFSRSRIDRCIKEPSFLQKTKNDLTDYCSTLEGDDSYSCWRAYFELKDLEKELPREEVEKFVRETGGVKSLIDYLHWFTAVLKKNEKNQQKHVKSSFETPRKAPFPIPDGLPKTQEELEEEEKARMPDSPFTKLLRSMGKAPAWYSRAPDHETD